MTITTAPATALRGDICPPWCSGEHFVDRGSSGRWSTHPDDQGVLHHSPPIDRWTAEGATGEPIVVRITGYRHDSAADCHDTVEVSGENVPGFENCVDLKVADARRLGNALLLACDLMEGQA